MTPEDLKAEADANNAAWRCGTFDTKGKEALEYFANLTHDPQDAIMTIEDMEKTIKFHEEELAAEDKRVEGTDEYPNYGDDFADMVHIARRLLDTVKTMEQERNEARRLLKAVVDMMRDNMAPDATHPHHLCDFIHRPDIGMCKVCEDWTDAMVMCYPDDFQDEEETK